MRFNLFVVSLFVVLFTLPTQASEAGLGFQGPYKISSNNSIAREEANVYLPKNYSSSKPLPVILLLHGFTGSGDFADLYFGMRFRADRRQFILLVPDGTKNSKDQKFWNATDTCCDFEQSGVDDVGYLLGLIRKVKEQYTVDASRVYIVGHSNGGFMANRLLCEASELFAGMASLAGTSFKDPSFCKPKTAVSMLHIHAVDDPTVLYQGSGDAAGAQESVDRWVQYNVCENMPEITPGLDLTLSIPGSDSSSSTWGRCKDGKEVALWTINSFTSKVHSPHVPLLKPQFAENVLDFLFRFRSAGGAERLY